ncbi:MAG: ATP-binding protein [Anaerolineae bacterium]
MTEVQSQDLHRLRTVIDAMPTPILVEDENRLLVCVNQAFCDMFGISLPPDQLIGSDCAQAAEEAKHLFSDPDTFIQRIGVRLAARIPVEQEVLMMQDGRVLERSYTPIYLDKVYQGHFWQYEDVTDRTTIARELEASRDRAWEASRLKSEFLAMMSHEIRTPMNGVLGVAELLLLTELDESQRDLASIIYDESHALLRILNDILDFSRIEAGKVILDPVPFSIYELFDHIAELMRHQMERKGLVFQVTLPLGVPLLYGDGGRLRQVVINLINNALKFTKKGQVDVVVQAEEMSDQRIGLHIQVRDTGIGIAPEKINLLFEPFAQGDTSTTREHGGTGLGLAIVKRLVTLLGGSIVVTSEPGRGSTFNVSVPMERSEKPSQAFATTSKEAQMAEPSPAPVKSSTKQILVVEDNAPNRELVMDYLHIFGYRDVQFAEDGKEAVELVLEKVDHPFALILMDIQLVRMDGITATKMIREFELSIGRHTPIVALTASAMRGDEARFLAAGLDDVLLKPIQRAQLLQVLKTYAGDPAN